MMYTKCPHGKQRRDCIHCLKDSYTKVELDTTPKRKTEAQKAQEYIKHLYLVK